MNIAAKENIETFRDSVTTVNKFGKRVWLYPKKQTGKIYNWRHALGYVFLGLMFVVPFLKYNDHPLFLFNVIKRTFIIFGVPFFPQDTFLFALAMLSFIVFIILFSAVFGRIWCGWACPQTIFMEMVFRKIEYWIEGDASERKRLDLNNWSAEKLGRKALKHVTFYFISFIISNVFLAYVIGVDELFRIISEPVSKHFGGFSAMLIFSGVFYFVFSRMREQICLIVCPYGRLQGVLLDKDSMQVSYDFLRGEPRGKATSSISTGDCIDCKLCVNVCPTGIDIRNGSQLECISCSACIDACNSIMRKVNRPEGLIRYASTNQITNKAGFRVTPRIVAYLIAFIVLMSSVTAGVVMRSEVEATMLRLPGMLYQKQVDGTISNLYSVNLVNKTFKDLHVQLKLNHNLGMLRVISGDITVPAAGSYDAIAMIRFTPSQIEHNKTPLQIDVMSNGIIVDRIETVFIGPVAYESNSNNNADND